MSAKPQSMAPTRRRPIPGMSSSRPSVTPPPADHAEVSSSRSNRLVVPNADDDIDAAPGGVTAGADGLPSPAADRPGARDLLAGDDSPGGRGKLLRRQPAADYAATRLVNFRIPVDLHDRFRQLVRDAEREYPRLRRPSLTELMIALLEEGPQTADEVVELIRRKRAAENEER